MVTNKTGGLFRLSVLLMQSMSSETRNYIPLVNELGLLYQVLSYSHHTLALLLLYYSQA